MGKFINLENLKFGKLTVLEKTDKRSSNGSVYWRCLCDCGNECLVITADLKDGHTISCGCYRNGEEIKLKRRKKGKDLTGQKFGNLTAQYKIEKDGKIKWHCICDCGNECDVITSSLTTNKTKSCGCLKYKQMPSDDIAEKRFGKLIAIAPTTKRSNRAVIWKCQCDCGNICYVARPHLINGYVSSCGCLSISKGELKIKQILSNLNISFETQKTFPSCIFPNTKYPAYFDFFINNKIIIEYDGEQHFLAKEYFGGEEELKKRQQKDLFKNQWCKKNNIPLIRIPYTDYDKINEKYLLERIGEYV